MKRSSVGETDQITTIFTKEHGKLSVVSKGIRKLSSSKLAILEPGNEVSFLAIRSSLPILTEAKLLWSPGEKLKQLEDYRRLFQVLETLDKLLVDEDTQSEVYVLAMRAIKLLFNQGKNSQIKEILLLIVQVLGYDKGNNNQSILELVEEITQKKVRSFEYLTV